MQTDSLESELQPKELRIRTDRTTISSHPKGLQASLRIIETPAEFEELRDTWSAWSDGPATDLDLFSISLRNKRSAVRPHVMVVYRGGLPDCMLIGWLDQGRVSFKVGPFTLFRPEARILRFVQGGFLGNQSWRNSRFLVRAIIRSLNNHEAHAAEFSPLRVGSPLCEVAKRRPNVICRDHFTPAQIHRYMNLPASFDEFFRGLSAKNRENFTRHARMLMRDFPGRIRFESVRSERDVEDFARKADEVSQKTYQRALGVGFVNDLETCEMLRVAAQKAALRTCLLYIGNQPIAFTGGIISNRTLHGIFTGYDPGFKKYSPGLQVQMRLIEESFEPKGSILRVDAGHGDFRYKRGLFDSSWEEHPVWIFAPTAKGLSLHVFKLVSTLFHSFAMRLFAKSEYLRRGKKMWHARVLREFQRKGSGAVQLGNN